MPGTWKRITEDPVGVKSPARGGLPDGEWRQPEAAARDDSSARLPTFLPERPLRTLADLVVPDSVLRRVETAVSMVEHHSVLYQDWNLRKIDPRRSGTSINLYGPSGTGKTLCAEALADRLGRPFLNVNYAEIESRYVGDTPKNIVRCFAAAREHNAVLVFDEADAILGARLSHVTQSADHSVNVSRSVMLTQLDRHDGPVVFTSNFPQNYDLAFLRRILTHVRFELPDVATRQRLWGLLIPDQLPRMSNVATEDLAARSAGLSGGDITNIIIAAASRAILRPPNEQLVRLEDLQSEIDALRGAKSDVGKLPGDMPVVSSLP